jgi:hypothetical protein
MPCVAHLFLPFLKSISYSVSASSSNFCLFQVVKRRAVSDIDNDDGVHLGRKRSVRDRLGNNMVGSESYDGQQRNKRYLSWTYKVNCGKSLSCPTTLGSIYFSSLS